MASCPCSIALLSPHVLNVNQFKYLPKTSIKQRNENIRTFCLDLKCKTCICDTIDCLSHEGPKILQPTFFGFWSRTPFKNKACVDIS